MEAVVEVESFRWGTLLNGGIRAKPVHVPGWVQERPPAFQDIFKTLLQNCENLCT